MTTDDYTPSETAERIKREWLATHAGSGFEDAVSRPSGTA